MTIRTMRQFLPLALGVLVGATVSLIEGSLTPSLIPAPQRSPAQPPHIHLA